jgi:hypothetical protein
MLYDDKGEENDCEEDDSEEESEDALGNDDEGDLRAMLNIIHQTEDSSPPELTSIPIPKSPTTPKPKGEDNEEKSEVALGNDDEGVALQTKDSSSRALTSTPTSEHPTTPTETPNQPIRKTSTPPTSPNPITQNKTPNQSTRKTSTPPKPRNPITQTKPATTTTRSISETSQADSDTWASMFGQIPLFSSPLPKLPTSSSDRRFSRTNTATSKQEETSQPSPRNKSLSRTTTATSKQGTSQPSPRDRK